MYSYDILETFIRKKPTDDRFTEEMSLKSLVEAESLSLSIIDVADTKLLKNESDFAAVEECLSSTMGLALCGCANSPD